MQQDGRYYLYGQTEPNQWKATELDRKVAQALPLPFPVIGQSVYLPYHKDNKPLFKHIHERGAHIAYRTVKTEDVHAFTGR